MHDDTGHGGLPGLNMGSIQSLGIMNALKTGDPKLDMILALLMPFALSYLLTFAGNAIKFIKNALNRYWYGEPMMHYHERRISHRSQFNTQEGYRMNLDEDTKNETLIKALKLYLHTNVDMKLKQADVDLTEVQGRHRYGLTIAGVLSKCRIVKNPPANQWHKLGQHGKPPALVELKIEDYEKTNNEDTDNEQGSAQRDDRGSGDKNVQVKTFRFRSLNGKAIDDFLDAAYTWYIEELRKSEDTSRYYYDLEADECLSATSSRKQRFYTRFKLSSDKTFDSLFFPEKGTILRLVDNFMGKTGKYAIRVSCLFARLAPMCHISGCSCFLSISIGVSP